MSKKQPQPAPPDSFLVIREAAVPKLGQRASGKITYQILADAQRQELFLRISANASGGYFSREAVPVTAIRRCLDGIAEGKTLRAVVLRPAFVGKSINNAGFLGAALLAEGLLARDPDAEHELVPAGDWAKWEQSCRTVEGDFPVIRLGSSEPDGETPQASSEAGTEPAAGPAKGKPKSKASKSKADKQASDAPAAE